MYWKATAQEIYFKAQPKLNYDYDYCLCKMTEERSQLGEIIVTVNWDINNMSPNEH